MKSTKARIEVIRSNGYQIDFGTVFEHAFENYKKIVLYASLMLLVFSIVLSIVTMAGLISYIGAENLEEFGNKMKQMSSLKVMPPEIAIPLNAGLLFFSAIINPFMAGFLKMADCGEKGEEFHISTMFSYYKFPYFFNIFISVFIIGGLGTGLAMLLESAGFSFIGTLITTLISFITFLTIPLIVFGDLNVTEAIKSSIIIVSKQPLVLLGLLIVGVIAGIIGIFGLCIGIFFTLPFMYSMNYVIYKTIVGIDEPGEIEEIRINEN
jgi:hypothetical protein